MKPEISIVIPAYNEEESLYPLFDELYPVMVGLERSFELIFINDGSKDKTLPILYDLYKKCPEMRVIDLNGNFGQHMAIMAGFEEARGEIIITLDADLQNPPEEIGNLLAKLREGYDYVGTIRQNRQDSWFRRHASRAMNNLREKITHITMTDQGCMLRGYSRQVVQMLNQCEEGRTFIPALAYTFASRPIEIEVAHEERFAGESKYSLYSLIRLNFDLVTGFSTMPLQAFSLLGVVLALGSTALFFLLLVRRFVFGAEVEGVFTLFALIFALIGVLLFGVGLLGEYIGRIYEQVRGRPRFVIQAILEQDPRG